MVEARMVDKELTWVSSPGEREGQQVLQLTGPITLNNLPPFEREFRSFETPALLLDLTHVPYMDSAGLGLMLKFYVTAQRAARRFVLIGVNDRVMALFSLTKVDSILPIFPSLAAAFESLAK